MNRWGIVKLANGGKLDGSGYGGKIHDTHGPECCGKSLWIQLTIAAMPVERKPAVVKPVEQKDLPYRGFFKLISSRYELPGGRLATRKDLEGNPSLKAKAIRSMSTWGIVKLADGGKLDGSGYGGKIHDTHGPECCAKSLWIVPG